jgi:hypothetical protein
MIVKKLGWTQTHTFAVIRSAVIGGVTVAIAAAITYAENVPATTLLSALSNKAALIGLLAGAAVASAQAVLNLYKPSPNAPVLPPSIIVEQPGTPIVAPPTQ